MGVRKHRAEGERHLRMSPEDEAPWGEQQREIDYLERDTAPWEHDPEEYEPSPYDGTYSEE